MKKPIGAALCGRLIEEPTEGLFNDGHGKRLPAVGRDTDTSKGGIYDSIE
jgi:hypothetical protein